MQLVQVSIKGHSTSWLLFWQVTLNSKWVALTSVTFTALRGDYPADPALYHAMAVDNMCLTVHSTLASPPPPPPAKELLPPPPPSPTTVKCPPPPSPIVVKSPPPPPPSPPLLSPPNSPPPSPPVTPTPAAANRIQPSAFPHGSGTSDESLFPRGADDVNSSPIQLPAPFAFLDTQFSTYSACSNGGYPCHMRMPIFVYRQNV